MQRNLAAATLKFSGRGTEVAVAGCSARRDASSLLKPVWLHVATPRYGMLRLVGRTLRRLVTDCPGLLDAPRRRRPGLLDARRDTSTLLKPVVDARRDPLVTAQAGWTHVATPRYGMLRLVGRTSRRLVTDSPGMMDAPRHRRPGLLDARRNVSSLLKPVVDARRDPSSRNVQAGWTHIATPRHGLPMPAASSSSGASEGLLDARRNVSSLLRLVGRTSRPHCSGWLDARRDPSSRNAQAGWTHISTPRHGLPMPAGRASSSSSGASERGC